jgi:N-acetylated-alpha-linked acidic dipeptidase
MRALPRVAGILAFAVSLAGNAASQVEKALEKEFDAVLTPGNLEAWLKDLSAHAHHAGSPYSRPNAEKIQGLFRSWGYDAAIEEFSILYPKPVTRVLEMTAPEHFTPCSRRTAT